MIFNDWVEAKCKDGIPRTCCPSCLHPHAIKRVGYIYTENCKTEEIACPICRKTFTVKRHKKGQGSSPHPMLN